MRSLRLPQFILEGTQIILEIIDAPGCIGLGILLLVTQTALEAAAGLCPGRGVETELQSLAMNIVGQRLHVGKSCVRLDVAGRIALTLPSIVYVDVHIAGIAQAAGNQG